MIEKNIDKINWWTLSKNPAAIHLLEQNIDKISFKWLSKNPAIFTYDYSFIKNKNLLLHKELIEKIYHPQYLFKKY